MSYYNGRYKFHFHVYVDVNDHDMCKFIARRLKTIFLLGNFAFKHPMSKRMPAKAMFITGATLA